MRRLNLYSIPFWTIVIILLSLNLVVFSEAVITSPDDLRVQYIPDDAYYYLTLAKNFSSFHTWTFDSGISVTSGFHPLYAYWLALIFHLLKPNLYDFVTYGVIMNLLFALTAIGIMGFWGFKYKNPFFLMFLGLIISKANYAYNVISVLEWSLTVLIASVYCVWFFVEGDTPPLRPTHLVVLFGLGFFGSLARSDFGLFPFSLLFAAILLYSKVPKKYFQLAFAGFSGALVGLLSLFLHNFIFTGEVLQSSAKMKAYWAQFGIPNYRIGAVFIANILGWPGLLLLAFFIGIAFLPRLAKNRGAQAKTDNPGFDPAAQVAQILPDPNLKTLFMLTSVGICVIGYSVFYSRNGGIQPWYTANLITSVLLLIFAMTHHTKFDSYRKVTSLFAVIVLLMLISNIRELYPVGPAKATWPHQRVMYRAGMYLAENRFDCRIGAWNAGIIGYYAGGNVVNLDGLVNNDIYQYATSNALPTYISMKGICYIVDFENMFEPVFRVRGGYDNAAFLESLTPVKVFDQGEYEWHHLTLYRITE